VRLELQPANDKRFYGKFSAKTSVIFDVAAKNLIQTADVTSGVSLVKHWVSSEGAFSVVSVAKESCFILSVDLLHQRLNAEGTSINYCFLYGACKNSRNKIKTLQIKLKPWENAG